MRLALGLVGLGALAVLLWLGLRAPPRAAHAPVEAPAVTGAVRGAEERIALAAPESVTREVLVPPVRSLPSDTLRLRCVDESGAPLAGVTVTGHVGRSRFERTDLGYAHTDGGGRVTFAAPREGWDPRAEVALTFVVRKQAQPCSWHGPPPAEELLIVLAHGARLTGRVLRTDGSLVLEEDLELDLAWRSGALSGALTCTVVNGRFETPFELAGELVSAVLRRDERRALELSLAGEPMTPGGTRERDLVFPFGCDCVLTFVDQRSRVPLVGATLTLDGVGPYTTDETGSVALVDALDSGREARIEVEHPEYPMARFRVACPESAARVERVLEVDPGFTLAGVVVDQRNVPQAGIELRLDAGVSTHVARGVNLGRGTRKETKTDERGRFRLPGLPAGSGMHLSFLRATEPVASEWVTLPGDETRTRWVLSDPAPLHGQVLDAAGMPLASVEVWAVSAGGLARNGETDASGRFVLEVPPDSWSVAVAYGSKGPRGARRVHVETCLVDPAGSPWVVLRLPPEDVSWRPAAFVLHAFDAVSGVALERFDLLLMNGLDSTGGDQVLSAGPLGVDGFSSSRFEGRFEFLLSVEGYQPGRIEVTLAAGPEPQRVEFQLVPARD